MLVCIKCKQGLMDPIKNDNEPEYTDQYQCGHCGHTDTIPSSLIITSQLLCVLMGSAITLYLLFRHLAALFTALQFNTPEPVWRDMLFSGLALALMIGFGYVFFRALSNLNLRHRYLHPER